MACTSCGTGTSGAACGGEGGLGCNKLSTFDWLGDMAQSPYAEPKTAVEVRFKAGRKGFFNNKEQLELFAGDPVVVDVKGGYHLGYVSLKGEIVELQMRKKKEKKPVDKLPKILRKAGKEDLDKYHRARDREISTLYRTREIIREMGLKMKLSDVEFQADNNKATFYYSADKRVDFRELIRALASEFSIRVEMRQISLRHEAGRLGGLGSCGRELCCSTWLTDFKSVSTSAARYQNLSLNPAKLSGQCGRLKCCLNYELDTYIQALDELPKVKKPLKTQKGDAKLQKTDIFRKTLWFSYAENRQNWIAIDAERVKEIQKQNAQGKKVPYLDPNEDQDTNTSSGIAEYQVTEQVMLDDRLDHMEKKKHKKRKKRKKPRRKKGKSNHPSNKRNDKNE